MIGFSYSALFLSRWKALAWAVFMCGTTAYCTVPAADEARRLADPQPEISASPVAMPTNPWARDPG